jgi:poly-gamma-glutamate synthesis protein (capsule biosynthesis protein)
MLLTGNNHSFDTGKDGYLRTIEVVKAAGLEKLGTMTGPEDAKWTIQDINGIKVGMLSYTYETTTGTRGERPALNGLPMYGATYEYINCFRMTEPDPFLEEVKGYLAEMEAAGAEATIMFIHWGTEYQLKQNSQQSTIAQGLCDLGIDVIIGGHPHVVQPVDLLTSTVDENHKTVVLYSMGNAVSNQRLGNLGDLCKTAHTEDGVFFSVTFEKYSDGEVYLVGTELLPTWVNLRNATSDVQYAIIPLDYDRVEEWTSMFGINETTLNAAKNSYNRTMTIVGEGLEECQNYLAQEKVDREEYYYNLAWHPEMFETQPTEVVEETAVPETVPAETAPAA